MSDGPSRGMYLTPFEREEENRTSPEEAAKWRAKRESWGESMGAQIGDPHQARGDYAYHPAGTFRTGDAWWDDREQVAYQAEAVDRLEDGRVSILGRPRRAAVADQVVSRLQFGQPGIHTEDDSPAARVFYHDDLLPRRQ